MDAPIIISVISAFAAVVCGAFTYRASSRATNVESRKVDQEAYDRAIVYYEKQLDRVTAQVDRLNTQLDRVTSQLETEQDVSTTLRRQVGILQTQVEILTKTISELRNNPAKEVLSQNKV